MVATEVAERRSHLLTGTVYHRRARPRDYAFVHRAWYLAADLDELDELAAATPLLGYGRRRPLALRDADHFDGARGLREAARDAVRSAGLDPDALRITLVTYPRALGFVFNPVSFYLCRDRDGEAPEVRLVLAEVHNTHGERTVYAFERRPGDDVLRATATKRMYVSPFIADDARYDLELREDGDRLSIRIREYEGDALSLDAGVTLRRRPLTTRNLVPLLARDPLAPAKTVALIFFHALRLRARGVHWLRYRRAAPAPGVVRPRR